MATMDLYEAWHQKVLAEGEAKGEAKGEARGEAFALLQVLSARGLEPSSEQTDMIRRCEDREKLEEWLRRAATATRLSDVLE